jgi:hypothetical protein
MCGLKPRPAWKLRRTGGATGAIAVRNTATAARLPMRRQLSRHHLLKRAWRHRRSRRANQSSLRRRRTRRAPRKRVDVNRAATIRAPMTRVAMTGAGSSNAASARKDTTRAWIRIESVSNRNNRLPRLLRRVRR